MELDHLLDASSPRYGAGIERELDVVIDRATRGIPARRRVGLIAAATAVLLLGGTATAGAAGLIDFPWIPPSIDSAGQGYDASYQVVVTVRGEPYRCSGGIVLYPANGEDAGDSRVADAKAYLQENDWSSVRPDASLVPDRPASTAQHAAEQLSRTVGRQIVAMLMAEFDDGGPPLAAFSVKGIDTCQK